MADHHWLPLNLSSRAKVISEAVADLRRWILLAFARCTEFLYMQYDSSLPAELLATNAVTKARLDLLESEIYAFHNAVIPPISFHTSPAMAIPAIKQLAQRAHETLWDKIPLHAILSAHKGRAKELVDADEDGQHSAEIYVAYYRLLQLRLQNPGPPKDAPGPDPDYREFLHLERFLAGSKSGTKASQLPSTIRIIYPEYALGSDICACRTRVPEPRREKDEPRTST
ncbi:hypothetical protein B0H19DRAFT_1273828 [Mycena capillaripes]|nr:hypothetical protein B0H19DRAFT_1273828 [Mycena capillaripes]